jgi:hypothetical protein
VTGSLTEPTDLYPPRFRVRGFPDEAALAARGNDVPGIAACVERVPLG